MITEEMEVVERRKNKPRGDKEATLASRERAKLVSTSDVDHRRHSSVLLKMFNKVQVVYYLTRNGHLEHPHYLEVSHLATQPLRLKDVIDRLTLLRGKAMPCQYSWSCKRSYKNGYVWNDLSENDTIYASEGSEYVLKGSELIQHSDFSELREEALQIKGRHQRHNSTYVKPKMNEIVMNKPGIVHERRHSFSFTQAATDQNCQLNHNTHNDEDEEEEEEKGSCKSSNATYQDEIFSLPSTSSTNSDKQPPPPPRTPKQTITKQPTTPSESKRIDEIITVDKEDVNRPSFSSALARNPVLLQLIACAGGSVAAKAKAKLNGAQGNNKKFNLSNAMRNSTNIIPCLKQQLSTKGTSSGAAMISSVPLRKETGAGDHPHRPSNYKLEGDDSDDHDQVITKELHEDDDEDMLMVRFMSENPRFGNLQSEEKEYFSGTIVEAMTSGSVSAIPHLQGQPQSPVLTKSSSYNEHRSSKAGLPVAAVEEDKEKGVQVKRIIKCIPLNKSCLSSSYKCKKF